MDNDYIKKLSEEVKNPDFSKTLSDHLTEIMLEAYEDSEEEPQPSAFGNIKKSGIRMGFSWESLASNRGAGGRYESVGIKWVQYTGWLTGLLLFKTYRKLEKRLERSRHFTGPGGYEYEEAEYRPFKQKTKWVTDEGASA